MWLENMKALNWTPKETDSLCSKHFETKCFITHNTRTALKSGSVPTLFEGLFENTIYCQELQSTNDKSYSNEKIEEEESQPADFPHPYKYDCMFKY
ncbi:hypothetical protein evm_014855 [Chilo suppressalis]|nr:hypothetical protein evm_014855 [Chilo suppressalis]